MNEVFDLIFTMFGNVVEWLKQIPISDSVSLFDFSIAILIMTIVVVAFVPVVSVGSTNYVNETLKAERAQQEREQRELQYERDRLDSQIESRKYGLKSRNQKIAYIKSMEDKRDNL